VTPSAMRLQQIIANNDADVVQVTADSAHPLIGVPVSTLDCQWQHCDEQHEHSHAVTAQHHLGGAHLRQAGRTKSA
jgi:hypothetical protein